MTVSQPVRIVKIVYHQTIVILVYLPLPTMMVLVLPVKSKTANLVNKTKYVQFVKMDINQIQTEMANVYQSATIIVPNVNLQWSVTLALMDIS